MFSLPSSLHAKITLGLLLVAGMALLQLNLAAQEQQAQYTQEEYDAYQKIAAATQATAKIDLAAQFLKQYPKSGLRTHVVAEAQNAMQTLYSAKNWQAVINYGKKIQAADSENSIVIQMLADAYQQTKNYSQFVVFGEQAYSVNPSGNLAYYLAKAYLELGNGAKFFQWGDRAAANLPNNHEILLELTKQASGANRSQQAAGYAGKCLKAYKASSKPENMSDADWKQYSDHLNATCYYVIGNDAFQQNNFTSAVSNLENSLKFYKRNEQAYYFLGQAYWQQRKMDFAMANFAKAVVLEGRTAAAARQHLENLYKTTHRGSLAGLDRLLDQARADLAR